MHTLSFITASIFSSPIVLILSLMLAAAAIGALVFLAASFVKEQREKHIDGVLSSYMRGDGGYVEDGRLYTTSENSNSSTHAGASRVSAGQDFKTTVKSGEVWLELFSNNYAPAIIGPIKAVKDISITQNVTLVKGAPHLVHVVDEDGQPVSGADVQMYPKSHGGPVWKNSTDDQGNYTYKHRNPGRKSNLSVEKVGYVKERIVVTNDGKTEVVLKTAPISKGVVLSADGAPVAGAEIRLVANRGLYFNNKLIATTDQQGRFETQMLFPTGVYDLLVVSDSGMAVVEDVTVGENLEFTLHPAYSMDISIKGDMDQLRRHKNGKLRISFDQKVGKAYWQSDFEDGGLEVVEDSEDQVRLKVKRLLPGKFTLRSGKFRHPLTAKPGNQSIEITTDEGAPNQPEVEMVDLIVKFRCDGEFVKPSGELRVGSHFRSFASLEDGVLKARVKREDKYYFQPHKLIGFTFKSQHFDAEAGDLQEITIDVQPAGAVSGRIVDDNGEPVSASVSCRYKYRTPQSHISSQLANHFQSDSKGNFLLTPIPIGAKVIVKAGERFNPAVSDEVLIEVSKPVVDVQLQTAAPVKAKVRVIDDQGKPIYGSELTVSLTGHGSWSGSLVTDAKGECEISPLHPTWDYTVEAEPKRYVKKNIDLVQGETNILQLEQGAELRGQLLDKDGNPVPNQRVYAMFKNPRSSQGLSTWIDADRLTDSDGRFEFTRLPKTECEINSPYGSEPVLINAGVDDEPIVLRLKR